MSFEKPDQEPEKLDNYENPPLEEKEGVLSSEEEETGEARFDEYEKRKATDDDPENKKAA